MADEVKPFYILRPREEGYEDAGENARTPKLGLRQREGKPLRPDKPELPKGLNDWEARQLWKNYMLKCLEQEMHAHLNARGFELTAKANVYMLHVYDDTLGLIWDLYYGKVRDEGHALALFEACEMSIDALFQQLGVSLREINQKMAQIAMGSLRTADPVGFLERLLGG